MKLPKLLLVLGLSVAAGGTARADLWIENLQGPTNWKALELGPLSATDLQNAIDAAKNIDPILGGQLEADIVGNPVSTVDVGQGDLGANFGVHDSDTIGLNSSNSPILNGVTLLHEYQHLLAARAAGKDQDPESFSGPCGPNHHAGLTLQSASDLCSEIEPPLSPEYMAALCAAYGEMNGAAAQQLSRAAANGCTEPPPGAPAPCPGCP